MELSKFIKSETLEVPRSTIKLADYNPRTITAEERKALKAGIKRFGLVGGIIANRQTGMTLVGGHQRLSVMDELNRYDPTKPETDYLVRVDVVEMDEKSEKELNILLNNPNAQGKWDNDALARLIPEIDYQFAGLTEVDLSIIGVDYLYDKDLQTTDTHSSNAWAGVLDEEEAQTQIIDYYADTDEAEDEAIALNDNAPDEADNERAERIAHMKEVKAQVQATSEQVVGKLDAYLMLSFDSYEAKANFCLRFGYDEMTRFIKGEDFDEQIERIE